MNLYLFASICFCLRTCFYLQPIACHFSIRLPFHTLTCLSICMFFLLSIYLSLYHHFSIYALFICLFNDSLVVLWTCFTFYLFICISWNSSTMFHFLPLCFTFYQFICLPTKCFFSCLFTCQSTYIFLFLYTIYLLLVIYSLGFLQI